MCAVTTGPSETKFLICLLEVCHLFITNQIQTMKIMPSDSSSWNLLWMSKRWKLDNWGRRELKIGDKAFLYVSCCGIRVDTCGNKVNIITSHVTEENFLNLIESHLLTFICFMNLGNAYVSQRYVMRWKVKTGRTVGFC